MGELLCKFVDNIGGLGEYRNALTVEHRHNNNKRDFLFVNKWQGKHIPVSPSKAMEMFNTLGDIVKNIIGDNRVLVIGFAETATAIGQSVANRLGEKCVYRTQTTRCKVENAKMLVEFSEEHSHATEQYLYGDWETIPDFDYILFVEDEISTGKTIMNFIHNLNSIKPNVKFGVASICNWQTEENRRVFKSMGIDIFALVYGNLISNDIARFDEHKYQPFNSNWTINLLNKTGACMGKYVDIIHSNLGYDVFTTERCGSKPIDGKKITLELAKDLIYTNELDSYSKICVVGTEEFMFIPMMLALNIEEMLPGIEVVTHSTTRSPIDVMDDKKSSTNLADGIINRYSLFSAYGDYDTYIYNTTEPYDNVIICTDSRFNSKKQQENFIGSIFNAFMIGGTSAENIKIIQF